MDNLRAGYDAGLETRAIRKMRQWARLYEPNPELEAALALKETDPAAYRDLGAGVHMQVGYYLQSKLAYESLEKEDLL